MSFTTPHVGARTEARKLLSERARSIAARMLRCHGAVLRFAATGRPETDHPEMDVSISHSGRIGVVAVGFGTRVGIDLEVGHWTFDDRLLRRICTPAELPVAREARDPLGLQVLWTRKESCMKLWGTGLRARPSQIGVSTRHVRSVDAGQRAFVYSSVFGDGALSLATSAEHLHIIYSEIRGSSQRFTSRAWDWAS